jgi:perosamine synthetase
MTDIQAAIGRVQLKKLPTFLQRREKIFQRYKKEGLELLDVDPELKHISPVRYRAILKTTKPQIIINSLQSIGVKSIIPTNEYIVSENQSLFPNSFQFTRETVSLPIYPSLTNSEIDVILSALVKK